LTKVYEDDNKNEEILLQDSDSYYIFILYLIHLFNYIISVSLLESPEYITGITIGTAGYFTIMVFLFSSSPFHFFFFIFLLVPVSEKCYHLFHASFRVCDSVILLLPSVPAVVADVRASSVGGGGVVQRVCLLQPRPLLRLLLPPFACRHALLRRPGPARHDEVFFFLFFFFVIVILILIVVVLFIYLFIMFRFVF
jgi:hypothetical protein